MAESWEIKAKHILDQTRNQIRKAADGSPDDRFKINRYVYARLMQDERKRKPKKADLFDRQKGICWICKERIDSIKDTDTHRINEELGYDDANNVVLVHRSCHQRMQARRS